MTTQTDNRTLLQKADLALSDLATAGVLQPAQAARFIRIAISESAVMDRATVRPMRSPKELLEKIRFGSRILRAGSEATALPDADRAKPDLTKVELDAKLFKAEVDLSDEVLEDSIERGALRNTVMQLMAERSSLDMDEVLVNGDTASADPFLAQFDGIRKQATSNVISAGGQNLNKSVLRDAIKAMPKEFLRRKRDLVFFTGTDAEIDYRDSLADRIGTFADGMLQNEMETRYSSIPVIDVPVFPEDLGGGNNETEIVLTNPRNITVGMWRRIKMETDKLVREGVLLIVASMRFDVKYQEETAVVKVTTLQVD
jgi:hypothetical protein